MKSLLLLAIAFLTIISCKEDEGTHDTLKGYWSWKSSCGGFAGCFYPSETDTRLLVIGTDLVELRKNGNLVFSYSYAIQQVQDVDTAKIYEVNLEDGTIWNCNVSNRKLTIEEKPIYTHVYKLSSSLYF